VCDSDDPARDNNVYQLLSKLFELSGLSCRRREGAVTVLLHLN